MKKRIIIGPVIVLILWFGITSFHLVNPLLLPSPKDVFSEFFKMIASGNIFPDLVRTIFRTFSGFIIACGIGIPIGLVMGYSRNICDSLEFLVDFFRSIPSTALFPLFMLAFGLGDNAKIANVVFACTFVMIINSIYGVKNSNKTRILVAKIQRLTKKDIFVKVIFPEALPEIVGGMRVALSIALIIVVVTEMFIGTKLGLGKRIYNAHLMFRISEMYSVIFIAGLLGYGLNKFFVFLERKVVHWAGK